MVEQMLHWLIRTDYCTRTLLSGSGEVLDTTAKPDWPKSDKLFYQ